MHPLYTPVSLGLISLSLVFAYKWPNPMEHELDHHLYDHKGYGAAGSIVAIGVPRCSAFLLGNTSGRQNAAEVCCLILACSDGFQSNSFVGSG
jgi:hypothetical protein